MTVKRTTGTAAFLVLGLLAACGDDANDFLSAADEAVEIEVVSGGDADHSQGHSDEVASHDQMAADEMAADDHDEMAADEMAVDDHDETALDDADAAAPAGMIVNVDMLEFGFVADTSTVPIGQPVTFRLENTGVVPHEAMFGSLHQQEEFAQQVDHGDGHGSASHHGDVAAITLDAGQRGDIVLEFSSPGELWIGCHLPGHYEAGMSATLAIA